MKKLVKSTKHRLTYMFKCRDPKCDTIFVSDDPEEQWLEERRDPSSVYSLSSRCPECGNIAYAIWANCMSDVAKELKGACLWEDDFDLIGNWHLEPIFKPSYLPKRFSEFTEQYIPKDVRFGEERLVNDIVYKTVRPVCSTRKNSLWRGDVEE